MWPKGSQCSWGRNEAIKFEPFSVVLQQISRFLTRTSRNGLNVVSKATSQYFIAIRGIWFCFRNLILRNVFHNNTIKELQHRGKLTLHQHRCRFTFSFLLPAMSDTNCELDLEKFAKYTEYFPYRNAPETETASSDSCRTNAGLEKRQWGRHYELMAQRWHAKLEARHLSSQKVWNVGSNMMRTASRVRFGIMTNKDSK